MDRVLCYSHSDIDYDSVDANTILGKFQTSSVLTLHIVTRNLPLLGEDDLLDVMEEVISIKSAYVGLGRGLRLPAGKLSEIRKMYPNDAEQALNDVLLLWLQREYNVDRFGPPTWRMIVKAVDSPAGGKDHKLAMKIARDHPISEYVRSGADKLLIGQQKKYPAALMFSTSPFVYGMCICS